MHVFVSMNSFKSLRFHFSPARQDFSF